MTSLLLWEAFSRAGQPFAGRNFPTIQSKYLTNCFNISLYFKLTEILSPVVDLKSKEYTAIR